MNTVLRFVHTSGITDFYDDEVSVLHFDTVQPQDIFQIDFEGYYRILWIGDSYKKIRTDILLRRSTGSLDATLDRIEDLWDRLDVNGQPEAMKCFYKYRLDTATSIYVQMKRDIIKRTYIEGHVKCGLLRLEFYEAVPTGVAIHRKRIGV